MIIFVVRRNNKFVNGHKRGDNKFMLIDLKNIEKIYFRGESEIYALHQINLQIEKGEFVAITGQSGSGKSTLMNLIGCLDIPTSGEYYLNGANIYKMREQQLSKIRNQEIGFIFQGFNIIPELDAQENVELPLIYRGIKKSERKKMSIHALCQVGLEERLHHRPVQMSGGQQQRVAVARAIAAKPPIILADEPTGNLDSKSGAEVMEILKELHRGGRTIILITHDEKIASQAQRIVKIFDGKILKDQKKDENI